MPSYLGTAGPLAPFALPAAYADVPDIALEIPQRPGPIVLLARAIVGSVAAGVRSPSLQLAQNGNPIPATAVRIYIDIGGEATAHIFGLVPAPAAGDVFTIQGIQDTDGSQTIAVGEAFLAAIALTPDQARLADLVIP